MRLLRVVGVVPPEEVTRLHPKGICSPCGSLAHLATRLDTLEDVLRWGGDVVEVVVQDEYNHDVVLRGPPFLVFDTT